MSTRRPLYVGIDLGTTNSAAAVFDGERTDLVRNAQGGVLTPSVVRIDAKGKLSVGERARRLLDQDPQNVRTEFKRLMGSAHTVRFAAAGIEKKPEELAAEVLRAIREDIRAQFGVLPTCAVISVPALFELPQSAATSEAARLAGFERVELIQEPVASGLGAGFRSSDEDGAFLVYDLGGGTFDVSLLEAREGLLRVVGHDGDNFLGGRDFDAVIVDHLIEQLHEQSGLLLERENPEHEAVLRRLRAAAEDAKIELSRASEVDILIADLRVGDVSATLSTCLERATLEGLTAPLVDKTLEICWRLLAAHGHVPSPHTGHPRIGRVILVGGPTAMPLLRKRVAEGLEAHFESGHDPMTLVAEGAAYYAASAGLEARTAGAEAAASGAKVWLQFPAMSSDLNPFVVGRLLEPADIGRIAQVVIARADGSWTSPAEGVDAEGTFAIMANLLPRRPNPLTIEGIAADGAERITLSPSQFVIVHGVTLGDPPLSRSVGVALANNAVRVFFERGSPLPMRRSFTLRTVEALSPADPEGSLRVPVVQGELPVSHLCRLVGVIEIKASALPAPLPVDSRVDVLIELDRGGRLAASACLPDTGSVFEHVAQLLTPAVAPSELRSRLDELIARVRDARSEAFKHSAQKVLVKLTAADSLIAECTRAANSAMGGDHDAAEKAQRLLLDLDALLAEADAEVAWPSLQERANLSLTRAAAEIGEFGTPLEQRALEDAATAMRKAAAARNAVLMLEHLLTIEHLAGVAGMREDGAWEYAFERAAGRGAESKDPKLAARLVSEGQQALTRKDKPALERVVRALWRLDPPDRQVRERGHWSGVS